MKHGARLKYDFRKLPAEVRERAERLVRANTRLAYKAIRYVMCRFPRLDEAELESHVMWTLMRCGVRYDTATGWQFSTYAYKSLVKAAYQNATQQIARRDGKRKIHTSSYDAKTFLCKSPVPTPLAALLEEETRTSDLAFLRRAMAHQLSERERFVLVQRVIEEKTLEEVGAACDPPLTRERIRQIERNVYRKLIASLRWRRQQEER
jgi:RNA polymerase sigma factor (sigma-70 family)